MSKVHIVRRSDIRTILQKWQDHKVQPEAVQRWAEMRFNSDQYDVNDWEKEGSIANEVLSLLEMLDFNLMTEQDIPALLQLLGTQKGSFSEGFLRWRDYFCSIDLKARSTELADRQPYAPFCT